MNRDDEPDFYSMPFLEEPPPSADVQSPAVSATNATGRFTRDSATIGPISDSAASAISTPTAPSYQALHYIDAPAAAMAASIGGYQRVPGLSLSHVMPRGMQNPAGFGVGTSAIFNVGGMSNVGGSYIASAMARIALAQQAERLQSLYSAPGYNLFGNANQHVGVMNWPLIQRPLQPHPQDLDGRIDGDVELHSSGEKAPKN